MFRILFCLLVASGPLATSNRSHAADPVRDFLDSHCVDCHSDKTKKGNLSLESLKAEFRAPGNFDRWVKILDRTRLGEMPPSSVKSRPSEAELKAFSEVLTPGLTTHALAERAKTPRVTLRRLNGTEYENTLRDLLHLPGLSVKELLPDDGRADGYDKGAGALDISPILMSKYVEAADAALDAAVAQWAVPPEVYRARMNPAMQYDSEIMLSNGDAVMLKDKKFDPRFPLVRDVHFGGKFPGLGEAEKGGAFRDAETVAFFRPQDEAFQGRFNFAPVIAGNYRISFSTWSLWWNKGEVEKATKGGTAGLYVGNRLLGHFDARSLEPTGHELTVWLNPDKHLKFNGASLWPIRVSEIKGKAAEFVGPGIAVDYIQIEGPLHDQWPPESHVELFGRLPLLPFAKLPADAVKPKRTPPQRTTHDTPNGNGRLVDGTIVSDDPVADGRRLLTAFLPKLFRRPVAAEEVELYLGLVRSKLAAKGSFEEAMRSAYRTAMCSPDFLFLSEKSGPLDDWAVASRLSYFLWNSLPDDTLRSLAAAGKLRDPEVVRQQAARMFADPKGRRFAADFTDQWLDLREFDLTTPDRGLYPEYQPLLAASIRQETPLFFDELVRRNAPVSSLIHSDFAMVDARLAAHYGIPDIEGTRFREAHLAADSHRGGLLTQAAILKVTANGTTTSPVKRGAWVTKKILGRTIESPPPDITAIEPDVRGTTTIRELLAKHRESASCATCHARMDPPGFALESFDVIGGYRTRYRATQGKDLPDYNRLFRSHLGTDGEFIKRYYHVGFRDGLPVDATGQTMGGDKFGGIDEYKKVLLKDPRAIARNLVNQWVTYSTGAPVGFADRPAVEAILDKSNGLGMQNLLGELVKSPLFLSK